MTTASTSSRPTPYFEDYESDFEYDTEVGDKRKARQDLAVKSHESKVFKPNRQDFHEECSREQGKIRQQAFLALDAYTRHKKLINEYVLCYRGSTEKLKRNSSNYKTDHDVLQENHRFLWEEEDVASTWGQQLAKTYYDRLFKEYCLCDLSRYKEKKIGMRWRTEKELVVGKGQFYCGNVHCNATHEDLDSWEVLFGYVEHGQKKSALVKLRLCAQCSDRLHYGYKGKIALKKKNLKSKESKDTEINQNNDATSTVDEDEGNSKVYSTESQIWKQPAKEEVEPSKEDVFEEFLEELFL